MQHEIERAPQAELLEHACGGAGASDPFHRSDWRDRCVEAALPNPAMEPTADDDPARGGRARC
jgi:hypothetical protein